MNCSTAFGLDPDQGSLDPGSTAWQPGGRQGQIVPPGAAPKSGDLPPRRRASDLEPMLEPQPGAPQPDPLPAAAARTPAPLTLIDPQLTPPGDFSSLPLSAEAGLGTRSAWPDLSLPAAVEAAAGSAGLPERAALPAIPDRRTVTKAMARQAARRARMASLISVQL